MSGNSSKEDAVLSNDTATFGKGKAERHVSADPTETPAFGFPAVLADTISAAMNPPATEAVPAESPLSNSPGTPGAIPPRENPLPDFGSAPISNKPASGSASAGRGSSEAGPTFESAAAFDDLPPKKRGLFDRLARGSKSSGSTAASSTSAASPSSPFDPGYQSQSKPANGNGKQSRKAKAQAKQASGKPANQAQQQQGKGKQAAGQNQGAGKQGNQPNTTAKKNKTENLDFLWEADEKRSAKGDPGTTTVVESDNDYLLLPHPDIFNAYPPEVQRKIMQWADRDVRARRDDESLRQDALVRAQTARERTHVTVPVTIIVLCIVCATITGVVTRSAIFPVSFLVVALAVIISIYFTRKNDLYAFSQQPHQDEEEDE